MAKVIKHEKLNGTLSLSECNDGFWLYDTTRGMNLAMSKATEREAFISALTYYQRRLSEVESAHKNISAKVDAFVSQFQTEED